MGIGVAELILILAIVFMVLVVPAAVVVGIVLMLMHRKARRAEGPAPTEGAEPPGGTSP